MSPEEKVRLTHIVEAATLIASYINGVSKEAFQSDPMRQDAVMRRIQIIGEAVRHLSHQVVTSIPDFPAKEARGMRNVLVHDYEGVNLERLWDTAVQDIPAIRNAVEKYLRPDTGGNGWEKLKERIPDAPPITGDELP
jgi:uncharacterized protein with HEPN domain